MSTIECTLRNASATVALTSLASASRAEPTSRTSPLAVLQMILSNSTDLAFIKQYTSDDFTYVSLNYESPEVKQVLPWAGTTKATEGPVQTFIDVQRYWTVDDFQIQDSFENEDGAAIFGTFTYTSNTLGKTVTSPFAVLARGENGKLSYVQFMEDTFATVAASANAASITSGKIPTDRKPTSDAHSSACPADGGVGAYLSLRCGVAAIVNSKERRRQRPAPEKSLWRSSSSRQLVPKD